MNKKIRHQHTDFAVGSRKSSWAGALAKVAGTAVLAHDILTWA